MKTLTLIALVALLGLAAPAAAQTAPPAATSRVYGEADYLLWWVKSSPTPVPLVSNGSASHNEVFLGGGDVDFGHRNGAKGNLGFWLTGDQAWGLEVGGFFLPTATESHTVSSPGGPGSPLIAIPFFNPAVGAERISPLSGSTFSGTATEKLTNRLWGADTNLVWGIVRQPGWNLDLLGGFRYLRLDERLSLTTDSPDLPPVVVSIFHTDDDFEARNDFYGGQIGVRGRFSTGRFVMSGTLKVAVGNMRERMNIAGSFTTATTGPAQSFNGGYFAQATNSGTKSRDMIAVIPEAGINFGLKLTDWVSLVAGYSFLYANNVLRPGNQIDRNINSSQSLAISGNGVLSGPVAPRFKFEGSDFWAHGLTAGIAFAF